MEKTHHRCWEVYLRGKRIGEVLAATGRAACLRAIKRFKIRRKEDQRALAVRRLVEHTTFVITIKYPPV